MRGQLDHFEKWMGIIKVPSKVRTITKECGNLKVAETVPASVNGKDSETIDKTHGDRDNPEHLVGNKRSLDCLEAVSDKLTVNVGETRVYNPDGNVDANAASFNHSFDGSSNPRSEENPRQLAEEEREWIARRVDLIISPYSQYFYALVGWIGSKQFNRDLRTYSEREMKMKLTSHGLYDFTLVR